MVDHTVTSVYDGELISLLSGNLARISKWRCRPNPEPTRHLVSVATEYIRSYTSMRAGNEYPTFGNLLQSRGVTMAVTSVVLCLHEWGPKHS